MNVASGCRMIIPTSILSSQRHSQVNGPHCEVISQLAMYFLYKAWRDKGVRQLLLIHAFLPLPHQIEDFMYLSHSHRGKHTETDVMYLGLVWSTLQQEKACLVGDDSLNVCVLALAGLPNNGRHTNPARLIELLGAFDRQC